MALAGRHQKHPPSPVASLFWGCCGHHMLAQELELVGATLKEYAYRKIEIVGFSILYYRESRSKFQGLSDWCRAVRNCYCRSPGWELALCDHCCQVSKQAHVWI